VRLDPQNADYHHDLGARSRRGLIPQAIAEMQAALAINPSHAEALEALKYPHEEVVIVQKRNGGNRARRVECLATQ
jgi:hypothetical protein